MKTKQHELTLKTYKLLFERLYPQLCVFAYKYLQNLDAAKELVQDVFIKVWEDEIVFKNKDQAASFFYTAIKNRCINVLKQRLNTVFKRIQPDKLDKKDIDTYFMAESVTIETTAVLNHTVNKLPNAEIKVIELSLKDLDDKEIAKKLKISVNTVKEHKKVAYQKLKGYFSVLNTK